MLVPPADSTGRFHRSVPPAHSDGQLSQMVAPPADPSSEKINTFLFGRLFGHGIRKPVKAFSRRPFRGRRSVTVFPVTEGTHRRAVVVSGGLDMFAV